MFSRLLRLPTVPQDPFTPLKGDVLINCTASREHRLYGVFEVNLVGTGLYDIAHRAKALQSPKAARGIEKSPPIVDLEVDPGEMLVLLDAILPWNQCSLVPPHMALWRSSVLARLSPMYGSPAITAKAMGHLYDTFCSDPDFVYELPFTPADFTVAVAVAETALAFEEVRSWLLPGALTYCAQFPPEYYNRPRSFDDPNAPTQRSYTLPVKYRTLCQEAYKTYRRARKFRLNDGYSFASGGCSTHLKCSSTFQEIVKDAANDHMFIGAITRPSPELAKRLNNLCSTCRTMVRFQDDISLYVIWSRVPERFGDEREWKEIRECARRYIESLWASDSSNKGLAGRGTSGSAHKKAKLAA
ncbi:hypothetical protein HDZ31DRAFT_46878 [Schizophyllum fasciatum]